jgi:hypothetical protein
LKLIGAIGSIFLQLPMSSNKHPIFINKRIK